ncbi:hypothetical protein BGZ83_008700 [Gryganskiella cystojenkinii]|nr:hypothetical protein BGZ83_008700 [Gryganskiella cystojenkinii]
MAMVSFSSHLISVSGDPKFQAFQLDSVTTMVRVRESATTEEPYILLEDIRDALQQVVYAFNLNGERVPFLENKTHDPSFQQRIAYYPGRTLTVVPLPQNDHVNETKMIASDVMNASIKRKRLALEAAPNSCESALTTSSSSSMTMARKAMIAPNNTPVPASTMTLGHAPRRPCSIRSLDGSPGSYIYSSATPIEGILDDHHERFHREQQALMAQVLASRLTAERQLHEIQELRQFVIEMESRNRELQKLTMEKQQETLDRLIQIQSGIQKVLTQTFELHEYSTPRLFIVLPEMAYDGLDPTLRLHQWTHVKFRLYFLCECGETHTNPIGGPDGLNHVHIARHEGYAINRPREFLHKYGPQALQLLYMIKYGITIAGMVIPMLSAVANLADFLPTSLITNLGKQVDTSIGVLSTYEGSLDQDAPKEVFSHLSQPDPSLVGSIKAVSKFEDDVEDRNSDENLVSGGPRTGGGGVFERLTRIEGADLRRLSAFLDRKDHDRTLGNLYRTVDKQGHVKWICQDHYRSTYHAQASSRQQDRQFEAEIALNQGTYDHALGRVSVYLSSNDVTESFLNVLNHASGAFTELDLQFRKYSYATLEQLGRSLIKTNVSQLALTGHTFTDPHFPQFPKKKLYPILVMLQSGKIQSLHVKAMKDLFPQRISEMPKAGGLPFVRSLELTEVSLSDGEVFKSLLLACPNISVLGLTEVPLCSAETLTQFLKGVNSCRQIRSLILSDCSFPSERVSSLVSVLKSLESLREFDFGHNRVGDDQVCEIVETLGGRLERLSVPQTGFGDESAAALERTVLFSNVRNHKRLRTLDVSDNLTELSPEGMESFVRTIGRLDLVELVLPRAHGPCDELFSRLFEKLKVSHLERLELQSGDCGDLTAIALATTLSEALNHGGLQLLTVKLELPTATIKGALSICKALSTLGRPLDIAELSLAGSESLFRFVTTSESLLQFFKTACSNLTVLSLQGTNMRDEHAAVFARSLQELKLSTFRLQILDVSFNHMTPVGGSLLLQSLADKATLETLRIESLSFSEMGSMGSAVQQFLMTTRSLCRLTVSHVNLQELTAGLVGQASADGHLASLKAIEVQYVDGDADDILRFGEFLASSNNALFRLVVKHAQVCEDVRSLEYLKDCLEKNKTIVSLEWDYDQGLKVDPYPLGHFLLRNRELWSKKAGARGEDLVRAGVEPYLLSHIGRFRG